MTNEYIPFLSKIKEIVKHTETEYTSLAISYSTCTLSRKRICWIFRLLTLKCNSDILFTERN